MCVLDKLYNRLWSVQNFSTIISYLRHVVYKNQRHYLHKMFDVYKRQEESEIA